MSSLSALKHLQQALHTRLVWHAPVIIVATANDYDKHYLAHLARERRTLRQILSQAHIRSRHSELVMLPNATSRQVLEALERYEGRIAVFQYSGHAHAGALQLEDERVSLRNFARKLASEPHLRLVVLNGCVTDSEEARELYQHSTCALITTRHPITDEDATHFSQALYRELARGASATQAFEHTFSLLRTAPNKHQTMRDFEEVDDSEVPPLAEPSWQLFPPAHNVTCLPRLLWLPLVFALCFLITACGIGMQQMSSYQDDMRENDDAGLIVVRAVPAWGQLPRQRMLDSKLKQLTHTLGLALEEQHFHVSYVNTKLPLAPQVAPGQADGQTLDCSVAPTLYDTLEHIALQEDASLIVYFHVVTATNTAPPEAQPPAEHALLQPHLFIPSSSSLGEYVSGCYTFAERLILPLPLTEERVASVLSPHISKRLEALGRFLASVNRLEQLPIHPSYARDNESALNAMLATLVSDYWPETGFTMGALGKELLYYFAAGYLLERAAILPNTTVNCPTANGTQRVAQPLHACSTLLLQRTADLNPHYTRIAFGWGELALQKATYALHQQTGDACTFFQEAITHYETLSNVSDTILKNRAIYNLARTTRQQWEGFVFCPDMLDPISYATQEALPILKTNLSSYDAGAWSRASYVRAHLEYALWQLHLAVLHMRMSSESAYDALTEVGTALADAHQNIEKMRHAQLKQRYAARARLWQGIHYLYLVEAASVLPSIPVDPALLDQAEAMLRPLYEAPEDVKAFYVAQDLAILNACFEALPEMKAHLQESKARPLMLTCVRAKPHTVF